MKCLRLYYYALSEIKLSIYYIYDCFAYVLYLWMHQQPQHVSITTQHVSIKLTSCCIHNYTIHAVFMTTLLTCRTRVFLCSRWTGLNRASGQARTCFVFTLICSHIISMRLLLMMKLLRWWNCYMLKVTGTDHLPAILSLTLFLKYFQH